MIEDNVEFLSLISNRLRNGRMAEKNIGRQGIYVLY